MNNRDKQTKAGITLYNVQLITEEEYDSLMNKIRDLEEHNNFILTSNLEADEARFF